MNSRVPPGRQVGWLSRPGSPTVFLLPATLALVLGLISIRGPFVWDDHLLIETDPFIHSLANAGQAFLRSFWAVMPADSPRLDYYRPFTTLTYILQYALSGAWTPAYHLLNAGLYACSAGLLGVLCLRLGMPGGSALLAGLLFSAYPPHHENVNFISGRPDLLVGLFLLLAFRETWLDRRPGKSSQLRLCLLFAWTALACLSKELGYLFPIGAWLAEVGLGWQARSKIRIAVVAAAVLPVAVARQLVLSGHAHLATFPPDAVLHALLQNVRTLLLPWPLVLNLRLPGFDFGPWPWIFGAVWAVLAIAGMGALRTRGNRVAWALTWIFLLPSCISGVPANRMLYLPSFFLLPLVAGVLAKLRWPSRLALPSAVVVAAAGAAGYALTAQLWNDDVRLFTRMVQDSPIDGVLRVGLSEIYLNRAAGPDTPDSSRIRYAGLAKASALHALVVEPRALVARLALAQAELDLGRDSAALAYAEEELSRGESVRARYLKLQALTQLGRLPEAARAAEDLLARAQDNPEACQEVALAQMRVADSPAFPESTRLESAASALRAARRGIALQPGFEPLWGLAAEAWVRLGRDSLAVVYARQGLARMENGETRFLETQALIRLGRYPEALSASEKSLVTKRDKAVPDRWATLGWVQYQMGHAAQAMAAYDTALALSPELSYVGFNRALARAAAGDPRGAANEYRNWLGKESSPAVLAAAIQDLQELWLHEPDNTAPAADAFLEAAGLRPGHALPPGPARRNLQRALRDASRSWPLLRARMKGSGA